MNLDEFWDRFDRGERSFQGCVIQNINFDGIDFDGIDFSNADLGGANIRKTTFENCNFTSANFSGCDIECVSFTNSQFLGSNFTACTVEELAFDRCDLSESKFIDAQMDVYFYLCNLSKSQWQGTHWSGGLTECNLSQAQMDGLFAANVQIVNTIYPNGVSGELSWQNVQVKGEPPTPRAPIIIHDRNLVELKSALGIDYSMLRDLLSECRWSAAQNKTHDLIGNLVGGGVYYLKPESIAKISCTDLMTIDRLWVEYSWGRFGFSVQKEIWISIYGGYSCNTENYNVFRKQVWTSGIKDRKKLKDEKSIKQIPAGCYPDTVSFFLLNEEELGLANFYRHLSECQSQ
jgi:uncharacterized protein YjbI with pentapeptide repeats